MSQLREEVTHAFDSWAERYDQDMKKAQYFSPDWITRHLDDLDGPAECRVLDLACGTGVNVKVLSELRPGVRAHGIDISPKMLDVARRINGYEWLQTHDLNTPLSDIQSDTFDLVIAFGFLELLSDVDLCLSECKRVLAVGGTLWSSFRRFEADDELSPPRQMSVGGMTVIGYSADQILHKMASLKLRVTAFDTVVGYITDTGFSCPFYVLSARKTQSG
ncbi:MAG: class I SAM-dependent DNA methyltransferase [Steroidobacteraceae bacterium]